MWNCCGIRVIKHFRMFCCSKINKINLRVVMALGSAWGCITTPCHWLCSYNKWHLVRETTSHHWLDSRALLIASISQEIVMIKAMFWYYRAHMTQSDAVGRLAALKCLILSWDQVDICVEFSLCFIGFSLGSDQDKVITKHKWICRLYVLYLSHSAP